MADPATLDEYNELYMKNHEISGYGIEGVTNHFPCPFCCAPEWYVVRVIDFGQTTEPMECTSCGRSGKIVVERDANSTQMHIVQVSGPDTPDWLPIPRETT